MRLTLCLRNNTMSDTSSIHFLAVNHGGCKQTLRLVFPTDAHYTPCALAMGSICHFLQITSLNHLILTATRQKRKCKDMFVANKGRVFGCYRDCIQLRSFKMDAVRRSLFKDRALRKRLLPEFDGKSTCDIFCKWPRKRWPTYLYIDS